MKKQDVLDVKVTAFEGGINYWANIERTPTSTRDTDLNYIGPWIVVEYGDFTDAADAKRHTLTDAKLREGIKKAAKHFRLSVQAFVDDCDAERADVAVQFALLGEIVYG